MSKQRNGKLKKGFTLLLALAMALSLIVVGSAAYSDELFEATAENVILRGDWARESSGDVVFWVSYDGAPITQAHLDAVTFTCAPALRWENVGRALHTKGAAVLTGVTNGNFAQVKVSVGVNASGVSAITMTGTSAELATGYVITPGDVAAVYGILNASDIGAINRIVNNNPGTVFPLKGLANNFDFEMMDLTKDGNIINASDAGALNRIVNELSTIGTTYSITVSVAAGTENSNRAEFYTTGAATIESTSLTTGSNPALYNVTGGRIADDEAGNSHWRFSGVSGTRYYAGTYSNTAASYKITSTAPITLVRNGATSTASLTTNLSVSSGMPCYTSFKVDRATNTTFSGKTYTLTYDPNVLTLVDPCAFTWGVEKTTGAITQAGINITGVSNGTITFTVTQSIPAGKEWTGIVNTFKFNAIQSTTTTVTISE